MNKTHSKSFDTPIFLNNEKTITIVISKKFITLNTNASFGPIIKTQWLDQ